MTNDRIIELEYQLAEQELSSSKLSEELYSQQQRINKLEQQLTALVSLLKNDSGGPTDNEVPIDVPPHY